MNDNSGHIHYLQQIKSIQEELELLGLSETSEILKLAMISLYSQMGKTRDFEELFNTNFSIKAQRNS